MNLLEAISLSELQAGGPGSGCHGPNCGRPEGSGKHGNVGIKEGDVVKIMKPFVLWNEKTGNNDKYKPGLKALVMNVLPKVGNEQMLSLNVMSKGHESDRVYMRMSDVKLHRSTGETITPQPVPKSKVIQKFLSNDGATITYVKTPETREYTPRTIKDLANQPSRYKGQFTRIEKVSGADTNITRVYDTSRVPGYAWGREGPSTAAPRPGIVLYVDRYPNRVVVEEQSYQRWGFKTKGSLKWEYNNIGQAFGMLKRRYGISIPLSKERF